MINADKVTPTRSIRLMESSDRSPVSGIT